VFLLQGRATMSVSRMALCCICQIQHFKLTCFVLMCFALQGKPIDFAGVDDTTARWVQDFSVKPYATPAKLESIDGEDLHCSFEHLPCTLCLVQHHILMINSRGPVSSAAHTRLSRSSEWSGAQWLSAPHPHTLHLSAEWALFLIWHFNQLNRLSLCCRGGRWSANIVLSLHVEPVCAVGHGVSALCCATEGQPWIFSGYSLTGVGVCLVVILWGDIGPLNLSAPLDVQYCNILVLVFCLKPSVFELVRSQDFANLPLIVEDFVKDSGGSYTGTVLPHVDAVLGFGYECWLWIFILFVFIFLFSSESRGRHARRHRQTLDNGSKCPVHFSRCK